METTRARVAAIGALAVVVVAGCATRGDLEDVRSDQRAGLDDVRAELEDERAERIAADERLATDLTRLRSDMEALRTEFDAKIAAVEDGLQFVLPVHFAFDEASVRDADLDALERFTTVVNRHYPGTLVTVEGFADPAGSEAYNRALSQRRAEAVREHLLDRGIQAEVRAIGYGEHRQVVPGAEKDDPGAEQNRRVVFVVERPVSSEATDVTTTF
ncbi:MAG: OmpA family protein [Gemmatimonadota bacterium]